MKLKILVIGVIVILVLVLVGLNCAPGYDFSSRVNAIVKPDRFDMVKWQFGALFSEIKPSAVKLPATGGEADTVARYFDTLERLNEVKAGQASKYGAGASVPALPARETESSLREKNEAMVNSTEKIIEQQIRETLRQQGIFNPVPGLKFGFPPVNFKLDKPPQLLVVSPRDRIERIKEVMLLPDLTMEKMESLEARVEEMNVSAIVVEIGGLGATFPTLVDNKSSLRFTIDAAVEEWLHQYLAFKPLGFRYVLDLLGIARNYDIVTINETLAGMVSKEIGSLVYEEYYAKYKTDEKPATQPTFDFNREMRELRKTVDSYLAQGEVTKAEQFMEQQRQFLATKGYYIRKLNQAYFAFHGSYADSPTSISPIGAKLKEIRSQSASLKDFLNTVARVTSVQDLDRIVLSGK